MLFYNKKKHKQKCILLIDDDQDLLFLYTNSLEKEGFKVVSFYDPLNALREFNKNYDKYDAVITDICMPYLNGYEVINRIKSINLQIKVVLISAQSVSQIEIARNLKNGIDIDRFVCKSLGLERFTRIVKWVLQQ